ncbi:NoeE-like protein [Bradyrhizobium nanningense]|uniref:NoeE-like protein n=2 Tax=Bradyrhizobium nanningense TaxID=1325118 RepID=A0A4V1L3I8_9BRAD|nr:NoeE-like protein [Bradyrhizobium nanningense]
MLRLPDVIISSLADLVLGLPTLAAHRTRSQTHLVQYEMLVAHPDEEVRRLLAALECDPAAFTSADMKQADYLRSSSFGDRKILERTTIDQGSVEAWRSQLSVEEMQTVTNLVGADLFLELGYGEELLHARKAGVMDMGEEVTELYRRIFRTWWGFRTTKRGALSSPSHVEEPVHTAWNVSDNRDAAIEMLRGEVARLEQILNIS